MSAAIAMHATVEALTPTPAPDVGRVPPTPPTPAPNVVTGSRSTSDHMILLLL